MTDKNYKPHMGGRELNLINALKDGPKTLRQLMDIIPTNNPAQYVLRINQMGYCTHTQWKRKPNAAGEWRRFGVYHLLPDCDYENAPADDMKEAA